LALLAVAAGSAAAQEPPATAPAASAIARPTVAVAPEGCVTADCHAGVKQFAVLHGPVNVNGCDACHTLSDAAAHTFTLARPKAELCTFCHQVDLAAPVVHKPLAEGECLSCHNPHGGASPRFTRAKSLREMCTQCHADVAANKKVVHGPVAAGACGSCHSAHTSKLPKLLNASGTDLCFECHAEMKVQMARAKVRHKAVEQDCVTCHDPHASDYRMQIRQPPLELCSSCHETQRKAALDAKSKHPPVVRGDACLTCHTAHGGDLADLLRGEPMSVCLSCHAKPITDDAGVVLAAGLSEVLEPGAIKHGPIRDGNCSGCHNTHGSGVSRLLAKPYPEPFYQPFKLDDYGLCFSCHDQQLVLAEKAGGLTGFRNGDRNLHFVHVNKQKGRTCRACHSTHASNNELHIRDSVPFGKWQMPIAFAKVETGGSCSPGCHKPYAYDRDNPVQYEAPAQGTGVGAASVTAQPTATQGGSQ
jgi:predicted CXXCH cytochrome family protein